jgi:hypothetical protein
MSNQNNATVNTNATATIPLHSGPRQVTDVDVQTWIKQYDEGKSLNEIAKAAGRNPQVVRGKLILYSAAYRTKATENRGSNGKGKPVTPEESKAWAEAYRSGTSVHQISKETNRYPQVIWMHIAKELRTVLLSLGELAKKEVGKVVKEEPAKGTPTQPPTLHGAPETKKEKKTKTVKQISLGPLSMILS